MRPTCPFTPSQMQDTDKFLVIITQLSPSINLFQKNKWKKFKLLLAFSSSTSLYKERAEGVTREE